MSIFSRIKDAIFSHQRAQSPTGAQSKAGSPAPRAAAAPHAAPAAVDVEQVLTILARKNEQKLNWRTSIVDLMKLLGIDSSLENRKELARELGYTGDTNDSAAMNIWLHKRVMQELEKNGGMVPASMYAA